MFWERVLPYMCGMCVIFLIRIIVSHEREKKKGNTAYENLECECLFCWGSVVLESSQWTNLGGQTGTLWSRGRVERTRLNQQLTLFLFARAHSSPVLQDQDTKGNGRILTCPGFTRQSLLTLQLSGFPALWSGHTLANPLPSLLLPAV